MSRTLQLFSALALGTALSACNGSAPKAEAEVIRPVLTQTVTETTSQAIGPFVGTIKPRHETAYGFLLAGRVLSREVGVGDSVKTGDLLATLEASVQEYNLASAQANAASAEAQFTNLAASEERIRGLVAANTASQAQLDAATAARQSAEAQRDQAKAKLTQAEDQLGYTRLTASADGIVTAAPIDVGQVVSAGTTIVTVAQPSERDVVLDLPQELATGLKVGDLISVTENGAIGTSIDATVREVAPSASSTARLRRVRLTLPDSVGSDAFRIGATVTASVAEPLANPAIVVPATAIKQDGEARSVWVVDVAAGTVASRAVTAELQGNVALVSAGLASGDVVAIAGANSLSEGQKVLVNKGTEE
jgi:membrane fusion protein, multidrug efflux system